jgi:glutathione S-transferase
MPDVLGSLDKVLADREFLEGGKFSVSDVAVGAYL